MMQLSGLSGAGAVSSRQHLISCVSVFVLCFLFILFKRVMCHWSPPNNLAGIYLPATFSVFPTRHSGTVALVAPTALATDRRLLNVLITLSDVCYIELAMPTESDQLGGRSPFYAFDHTPGLWLDFDV